MNQSFSNSVYYFRNILDLSFSKTIRESELCLCPRFLSKTGELNFFELDEINPRTNKLSVLWDNVFLDSEIGIYEKLAKFFSSQKINTFKVSDPSAISFILDIIPNADIHFYPEFSNFNIKALDFWIGQFRQNVSRIKFSPLVTLELAQKAHKAIDLPIELIGLGPLEIFHSKRNLLSSDFQNGKVDNIKTEVRSIDRGDKLYSNLTQTDAGTILFLGKSLFCLDILSNEENFPQYVSVEPGKHWPYYLSCLDEAGKFPNDRKNWPESTIAGFLKTNKTDKQFKLLKNSKKLVPNGQEKIGVVQEYRKTHPLIVEFTRGFHCPICLTIVNTVGESNIVSLDGLLDTEGNRQTNINPGIYLMPWIKSAGKGTDIYISNEFFG